MNFIDLTFRHPNHRLQKIFFDYDGIFSSESTLFEMAGSAKVGLKTMQSVETQIEIASTLRELKKVKAFVRDICAQIPKGRLKENRMEQLVLAANEVVSNIIIHAYDRQPLHPITIKAVRSDADIGLWFFDQGKSFDPDSVPPPKFDGLHDSGFGLYLISRCVDYIDYFQDKTGKNCTHLKINLT